MSDERKRRKDSRENKLQERGKPGHIAFPSSPDAEYGAEMSSWALRLGQMDQTMRQRRPAFRMDRRQPCDG
jgi:hypothetical protein